MLAAGEERRAGMFIAFNQERDHSVSRLPEASATVRGLAGVRIP